MKGYQINNQGGIPSLDITAPETQVQVEYDRRRGVLYVSLEGFTCLRICQMKEPLDYVKTGE